MLLALLPAACSHAPARPAVLERTDEMSLAALRTAIERDLGRSPIAFGAGDPSVRPEVSVLPPPLHPLEDRSLVLPTLYRIEAAHGRCYLVREGASARLLLEGVSCRPIAGAPQD
jgi:hypothetical protein